MWYAKKSVCDVFVFLDGKTFLLPIEHCKGVFFAQSKFYFLNDSTVFCYDDKMRLLFRTYSVQKSCNRIYADSFFIYTSSPDTGTVYQYNLEGVLLRSIRVGEHICDFTAEGEVLYAVSYHDNKLFQIKNMEIVQETVLDEMPQTVIFSDFIYILLNNEFYSNIEMFDAQMTLNKKIKMPRQIGELFLREQKLIFSGYEINYVLDKNLNFISIKKSTGKILCRDSDMLIYCEDPIQKFDPVNNITYPL